MSDAAQFGRTLRQARERRGLSVEALAEQTTIPLTHIEALEAGAIDALPRAMYRRAEARAYAEAVGLDPDVVLTQLRTAGISRQSPVASQQPSVVSQQPPVGSRQSPVGSRQPAVALRSHATEAPRASTSVRIGRALVVLAIGCVALFLDRNNAITDDSNIDDANMVTTSMMTLPAMDAEQVFEEVTRLAEPPGRPPTLRRAFYEPGADATGLRPGARLDGGTLVVRSTPPGARVTVNDVGWGETPVTIRYLPMGKLRVRVAKPDYAVREHAVELTAEQPATTVRFTLPALRQRAAAPAAPGGDMLVITSVPEGARVTVNGIGWGTTPVSIPHLPSGAQRVRIVKDQFRAEERVVHVGAERPGRVAITLKPQS
jgi:transcriptional regulator with XRE-family HTH domain